ncbi:MAG: hypothetical protein ACOYM7_10525 [Paludibacter sp.]
MSDLIVIAGCNGAGKSTFAFSFLSDRLIAFDYDKTYLENYRRMPACELMADKIPICFVNRLPEVLKLIQNR